MKTRQIPIGCLLFLFALGILSSPAYAQKPDEIDEEAIQTIAIHSRGLQRVGNTFESIWLGDNQTVIVPMRKTFEFDIQHRFGTVNNGYSDFFGLYAPSNIRMGIGYTPINNLMVGAGFSKFRMLWDVNVKYAILKERGKNPAPVSVTYYGVMGIDTRPAVNFAQNSDRITYFHQLMVARKINRDLSVQGSINLSHFNRVDAFINALGETEGRMNNDHLSFSILGRYKISDAMAFIGNYDQPLTKHFTDNPAPNLSIGIEIATPLHAFQIFVGNYQWMVPQYSHMLNQNDYTNGSFLIGFNITRLIDLQEEDMVEMMFKRKHKKK